MKNLIEALENIKADADGDRKIRVGGYDLLISAGPFACSFPRKRLPVDQYTSFEVSIFKAGRMSHVDVKKDPAFASFPKLEELAAKFDRNYPYTSAEVVSELYNFLNA